MRNQGVKILLATITAAFVCGNMGYAETAYDLDPVTVTASRYEKKDLDVPASTQVLSGEQLRRTGAVNLQKALAYGNGIVYHQKGPGGVGLSSMTSKIILRGMEDGTLILVNGTPINWRGKYNLEDIPLNSIEKVEIVRGGGAVLYGSQATGGVINIITKAVLPNTISAGVGNYGQQNYQVSAHAGKLSIAYNHDKWGDLGFISSTLTGNSKPSAKEMRQHFRGSEKNDIQLMYQLNDNINFLYNHDESWNNWDYVFMKNYGVLAGKARYDRHYERGKDFVQMNFKDGRGITGHGYYSRNTQSSKGLDYYTSAGKLNKIPRITDSKDTITSYGYDVQKVWGEELQTFLVGTSYDKEKFKEEDFTSGGSASDYERNILSVFGQWDRALTPKDRLILSARETWTTGAAEDKNYDNFSGQAQYLHKINEKQNWYISAGQSFVMPSFSNMYSTGESSIVVGNPNLKPQKGEHYEAGWKMDDGKAQYRVAVFTNRVKDDISFSKSGDKYYAVNQDTKNTGIEASVTVQEDNGWSWNYGLTYHDPQVKMNSDKPGSKTYWDRQYGRWQMNGGVTYHKEKWTASLNGTYLADRVLSPLGEHSFSEKPYLLTSFTVQYAPDKNSTIMLAIDNLLDREDNLNHSSGTYYSTPINYMVSYQYKF